MHFDNYQQYIHKSRYARFLPDKKRREHWDETVQRYVDYMEKHLADKCNYILDKKLKDTIYNSIHNMEVMPSMRAIMTAGKALERDNTAAFNCLASETNILTKEYGQVEIGSIVGKSVSVLNSDGEWSETTVETFGQQNLMKVDFSYTGYNGKETVYATSNHDWIVDGQRIQTKNLKKGMKIPFVLRQRLPVYNDIDYKLGIIHGLVYGDGSRTKYKKGGKHIAVSCERTEGYMIRLCSDQKDLLQYFEGYPLSYPKTNNGDPVIYLYDNFAKTHSLKELPPENETESYMVGFFRGWLAADGYVGKKQVCICVGSEEELWLRRIMPKYGVYFSGSYILPSQTNFGTRKKDSRNLKIWNYSLTKSDFIIERKRNNFTPWKMERTVVGIQQTNRTEEVYCVNVPKYHNFVIERGILTGNCSYLPVDDPKAFDECMHILMCGTGVGFSVERQYINKLPEIPEQMFDSDTTIVVKDSKEGWAKSLRMLIALLYSGEIPRWDLSKLRPAGSPLKTFGGRCLTGDTIVYKDRKKSRGYNEITIKDLFDMERSQGKWLSKPNHFKNLKIRCLNEETGEFYRNNLIAVHDNGIQDVYEIVTENGYRIKATGNHRFLGSDGNYKIVDDFELGDLIGVNGSTELKTGFCMDCGCEITRRATKCKTCNDISQRKNDCLPTTARQRKEVRDYRESKEICELCGCHENEARLEVHHIDGNPLNNIDDNLLCVCPSCHRKEDMKRIHFGNAYSCKYLMFDKIISIEYVGKEQTYDLEMQGPNHNFVANGFVSHNSSGPGPLDELFKFVVHVFRNSRGRKLTSLECHDVMCKIAEVVVVGGVRRSAMISLSNLSDDRMRNAKSGAWWEANVQRALSNNSAVYTEKPEVGMFMEEWLSIYQSKSGERGIFSREASQKVAKKNGRRDFNQEFGTNPCSEIILRPYEFCNLCEVIVRADDTDETLLSKVRIAAIIGTFQSTLTYFPYLRKIWQKNTEEERLLGVSLTGIYDCKLTNDYTDKNLPGRLEKLKQIAIDTNKDYAEKLGIPVSAAITCTKPSGCTTLDTSIRTVDGIKTMAEIFADYSDVNIFECSPGTWLTLNKPLKVYDENNDIQEVTKLFINGMSEVYEIEDENGNKYKFTGNHKLKTNNGWKRVDELNENDEIISF